MWARWRYIHYLVLNSFWFLPGLLVLGSILLCALTFHLDESAWSGVLRKHNLIWIGTFDGEGARQVLSTTTGSLVTATSLVFSMTLVSMTLASSQLGPRLLRIFMASRLTQTVLGIFVGTVIFNVLALTVVTGDAADVPMISLTVAMVLAIISFILLVVFIHHVSRSIQADTMIAIVSKELDELIAQTFLPDPPQDREMEGLPADFQDKAVVLPAHATGYIQTVEIAPLLKAAVKHDAVLHLTRRPGHFIVKDGILAQLVAPKDAVAPMRKALHDATAIGATRTPAQDLEFALSALVEIALRALSPSLNDSKTAIVCIDRLTGSLAMAMKCHPPPSGCLGEDGKLRLMRDQVTFGGMLDSAFDQIRQNAAGNVGVIIRLIEALTALTAFISLPEHAEAIARHASMIERLAEDITEPYDKEDVQRRLRAMHTAMQAAQDEAQKKKPGT
ncbi:DUF2254 domain-containing protein [Telmatospirillum sp. J64-1]|uniref:DUF2254 domain-containing protein n=1 Tax=Telmatospirillum sp. J64-1 TaxID=2502183 RepID=UPI00115C56E9|nr:DUF2254 domain-containing protein [Telmatospirillum sp. J64-1]